ncbi:MAG: hypothetical protein HY815_22050, partial [Candidatus Riflebacteria bacterium]|nr:hypothetical protein [Candidatus Riflebacteria bacterium]
MHTLVAALLIGGLVFGLVDIRSTQETVSLGIVIPCGLALLTLALSAIRRRGQQDAD